MPPSSEIFFSLPFAKKASHLPSGENVGFTPPSDPLIGLAFAEFISRWYSRGPSELLALKAMRVPSREIATARNTELREVPGGGRIAKRIGGFSCAPPECRRFASKKPAAINNAASAHPASIFNALFSFTGSMEEVSAALMAELLIGAVRPSITFSIAMRASPMDCNRWRGSLFKQRRISCWISFGTLAGSKDQSGSPRITAARVSETVSPLKAIFPVSISNATAPNDQISARRSTVFPRACSGDIYAAVPRINPALVAAAVSVGELEISVGLVSSESALAKPKSRTLTVPSGLILIFAGFKSRCTIPRS